MKLACTIPLPENFRAGDIFEFHRRDAQSYAEKVDEAEGTLRKGLAWQGRPACLTVRFQAHHATAELALDDLHAGPDADALQILVRRMLGLTQRIEDFERAYRAHPQLGRLIARNSGLRVPLAATPFEALTWAVTGQQISVHAAVALRRKLIQTAGLRHSGGLGCYPDAGRIAALSMEELRQAGFSQTKAQTLLALSRMVLEDALPLDAWVADAPPAEEIRERLLAVRGIGPWTVSYALLRGFGWLDGSLHGDAAVRRGMQTLLALPEKVGEDEAKQWLAEFPPWRALVAAHLWALNAESGQGAA